MGTHSLIGFQDPDDGVIRGVYCHYDGYYDNVGAILDKHYRDINKLRELIQLGNLSSLGPEIGVEYDHEKLFDEMVREPDPLNQDSARNRHSARNRLIALKEGQCTFYMRDYKRVDEEHQVFFSFEDFFCHSPGYAYLFVDNDWWCDDDVYELQYARLSDILKREEEEEE